MGALTIATAALLLVRPSQAAAQPPAPGPDPVRAAVLHVAAELRRTDGVPAGPIGFDARVVEERTLEHPAYPSAVRVFEVGRERETARAAALRAALSAVPARLDDARECATESPRSCRLRGSLTAVFAASDPRVSGDGVEVVVEATWMSNVAKQPVQAGTFRVTLECSGDAWRVREMHTLSIT